MPRIRAPVQSDFPYGITARCINRDWFGLSMDSVWEIMSMRLYFLKIAYDVEILSFVLMSNHFHMLMRAPESNLSVVMANFMLETSRAITKSAGRINNTWGQRHYRTLIATPHYYLCAYKYFYRNPVQAGICRWVEDYPYSTLRGLLGYQHMLIPVVKDDTLFSDVEGTSHWLNRGPDEEAWFSVRNALRRPEFKFAKDPNTKKANRLEFDTL